MWAERLELCVLCLVCSGMISTVFPASMQATFTPDPAVKGDTSQHSVVCSFSVDSGETFRLVQLVHTASDEVIATMFSIDPLPLWSTESEALTLKARGYLTGSPAEGYMRMVVNDTQCSDQGQEYLCRMSYSMSGTTPVEEDTTTLDIQAVPETPEPMSMTSDQQNVTEGSEVTFTCMGNVGRPAGNFSWLTVSTNTVDVTAQATQQPSSPSGCTFTRGSSLTLNLTRTEEGHPVKVVCLVSHPTLGERSVGECDDPDEGVCRSSHPINVQYPVSVSVATQSVNIEEGTDRDISCVALGNPRPRLIEWRREDGNETLTSGPVLTLHNVSLNDTGRYVCTAYNVIDGDVHNASDTVLVTVEKITTPSPTTTPPVTSAGPTTLDPDTEPTKAGLDDKDIIIIVVVLVAVVIIVAIIAIIIIVRRRKTQKLFEDAPEKSQNRGTEVNTMAMQSDPAGSEHSSENTASNKNQDGLMYADLQFDNKPRSRRPLAIDDSHTEYADIAMPQV